MNRPSYKELWLDERKDRDEQLQWIRNAVNGEAEFCNRELPYSEEEELARQVMTMHTRIAELEVEVTKGHELQDSYCDRIAELEAYIDELENPQSIQDACICEDNPQDDRAGLYIDPDCPVHGEAQDA